MTTMILRGPAALSTVGLFVRVYKSIQIWVDIFSEAQRMAHEAERRFTFGHH